MSETKPGAVEEMVADGPAVAMAMIRAANSVGSPLPWANALASWPGGGGFHGSTTLRWAVEDLSEAGLIVATPRGLMATAIGAAPTARAHAAGGLHDEGDTHG